VKAVLSSGQPDQGEPSGIQLCVSPIKSSETKKMDRRKNSDQKMQSAQDNNSSSSNKSPTTPQPTFLTSFPSFSPPDMTRRRRPSEQHSSEITPGMTDSSRKSGSRVVSTPVTAKKTTDASKSNTADGTGVASTAMNRTVQAAVNLRRTIMDSITTRSSGASQPQRIFTAYEAAADPLLNATDEHINRIIASSGGPIATIRKYSSDMAESNERVAAERNSKLKLVEENRQLRADLRDKEEEIEDLKKQLGVSKALFERYVEKVRLGGSPNIQFLDSPSGPYAFGKRRLLTTTLTVSEDSTGTILSTINDEFLYPNAPAMYMEPSKTKDIPEEVKDALSTLKRKQSSVSHWY
jgi:hypothetical protein